MGVLCFTAEQAGSTVTLNKTGSPSWEGYYSTDGYSYWSYTPGTTGAITLSSVGSKVYFKGTYSDNNSLSTYLTFSMTGKIAASGDIFSFADEALYSDYHVINYEYQFYNLFQNCTALTQVPNIILDGIYADFGFRDMFYGCTSLTTPPEFENSDPESLPEIYVNPGSFYEMFYGCTSLTAPSLLPFRTLDNYCYCSMYQGCTSIKLSTTQTGEYTTPYRIPTSGTGSEFGNLPLNTMFSGTGGTFTGTPTINTTYYLAAATPTTYTITTSVSPTGSGTVIGAGTYSEGDTCTITVSPASGYTFSRLVRSSTQEEIHTTTYSFTVSGDDSFTAYFEQQPTIVSNILIGNKKVQKSFFGGKEVTSMWLGNVLVWGQQQEFVILDKFVLDGITNLKICQYKIPVSLTITAPTVGWKATEVTVTYTQTYNVSETETIVETGTYQYGPFPQNETSEPIERTITFTRDGLTATTTFIQEAYAAQTYTITNSGITAYGFDTSSVITVDPSVYDGPYESNNNGVNNSYAVSRIDFTGYSEFTIWINSYAESRYDYTVASELDASTYPTENTGGYSGNGYSTSYTSSSGKYSNTRGYQKNPATALSETYWRKITYATDGGDHFIYITYRKDSSTHSSNDKGYFIVEK